jgi:hypothetical protein
MLQIKLIKIHRFKRRSKRYKTIFKKKKKGVIKNFKNINVLVKKDKLNKLQKELVSLDNMKMKYKT